MASTNFLTDYDPSEVALNFGGVPISGFATGTFISVVKNVDTWSTVSGIGGEGMFVKNNDNFWTITLTLMSNSAGNDYLSSLANSDQFLVGYGFLPVYIKNNLGRELFTSPSVKIAKMTDVNFSDAGEAKVWTLLAYFGVSHAGGH